MLIEIPDDNSIVKWKNDDKDEWNVAEIDELIKFADFVAKNVVNEDFDEDIGFYAEVLCRKLVKLGLVKLDGDNYKYCGTERLKARQRGYEDGYHNGMKIGKTLNPKVKQGEWIPVSERLPDKNMPCLVSVGKLNLTKIAMYSDLMETINHKIFWQGDYGKNNFQNITEYVNAWQSLPEPYKKGGKE